MTSEISFTAYVADQFDGFERLYSFQLNHVPPVGSVMSFPGYDREYKVVKYEYQFGYGGGLLNDYVMMIVER